MSMKKTKTSFRVEVTPRHPGDYGICFIGGETRTPEEERRLCEEIAEQIRRHVDGINKPCVTWDVEKTCEFCGYGWTEADDSPHNGGCCNQDCDIMDALGAA